MCKPDLCDRISEMAPPADPDLVCGPAASASPVARVPAGDPVKAAQQISGVVAPCGEVQREKAGECPVCLTAEGDWSALPCGHAICNTCLAQLVKAQARTLVHMSPCTPWLQRLGQYPGLTWQPAWCDVPAACQPQPDMISCPLTARRVAFPALLEV